VISCIIRYYFATPQGRIALFERQANFAAVPFVGSRIDIKDPDCLRVDEVVFQEDSKPVLIVEKSIADNDGDLDDEIQIKQDQSWELVSDIQGKIRMIGDTWHSVP